MKRSRPRPRETRRRTVAGVSVSAFARELGVDEKAIRKAIASRRLVSVRKIGRGFQITDPAAARIEWETNAGRPAKSSSSSSPAAAGAPRDSLIEASRLATIERGRRLRNENDLQEGKLHKTAICARLGFESNRIIREAVLNVSIRLAAELAGETDPDVVFQKLDAALREALGLAADRLEASGE